MFGRSPAMRFAERLQQRIEKTGSRPCVGLDPRPGDGGASAARDFLKQVAEETAEWAAAYKPNMAYFEAMGIEGIRLWEELIAGLCLMLGILRKGAILTLAGLVVVFAISVGWAWSKGLDITCGCHGGDAPIQYWAKAFEFAGYFILLGWLWWIEALTGRRTI